MNGREWASAAGGQSRRTFLRLIGLGAGGTLLAACAPSATSSAPTTTSGARPTAAPQQPAAAAPTSAPAAPAAKAPQPTPAAGGPTAPAAQLAALEAAARQEGTVVVYSSFNLDEFDKVYPLFEKRYPGMKVDHVRANGEKLLQRLLTEAKAGRVLGDVLETNGFEVENAISSGVLESWKAPNGAAFPASLKDDGGVWTSTRQNTDVVAWNTNLVKPGEEPKSYDELADPKWKGKILVEADDIEMFAALVNGKFGGSVERAQAWLKGVAANRPEAHKGHTETAELLAAGQGAIFLGAYGHRIESLKKKKAPVDWMKTEGAQLLQIGGVIKGAPHANAARLFMDWLLSAEAQQAIADVGRIASRPGTKLKAPLLPDGVKWYPARPEMARDFQRLSKLWKETLEIS